MLFYSSQSSNVKCEMSPIHTLVLLVSHRPPYHCCWGPATRSSGSGYCSQHRGCSSEVCSECCRWDRTPPPPKKTPTLNRSSFWCRIYSLFTGLKINSVKGAEIPPGALLLGRVKREEASTCVESQRKQKERGRQILQHRSHKCFMALSDVLWCLHRFCCIIQKGEKGQTFPEY